MLYIGILSVLTTIQVFGQDTQPLSDGNAYTPTTAVEQTTETVPTYSDSSSNYESTASTAISSESTSDHWYNISEYTTSTVDVQSQTDTSPTSSSITDNPQTANPSTPLSTPIYYHIKYKADPSKCLAVYDQSHTYNTPVALKDCSSTGQDALWEMDIRETETSPASIIKSRVFKDEEWCLEAGSVDDNGHSVVLNPCNPSYQLQIWQYTSGPMNHLVVYDDVYGTQSLDLEDGDTIGGGRLQTWVYSLVNDHQLWIIEPASN